MGTKIEQMRTPYWRSRIKEHFMKNTIKALAIIALVAVIGFSFTACGGGGVSGGSLTITGLPSGTYSVGVFAAGTDLSTLDAIDDAMTEIGWEATSISSSNVFTMASFNGTPYTGSGSKQVFLKQVLQYRYATVNFSNGSATVPFSNFTAVTE
jgi:hypothetical protein